MSDFCFHFGSFVFLYANAPRETSIQLIERFYDPLAGDIYVSKLLRIILVLPDIQFLKA